MTRAYEKILAAQAAGRRNELVLVDFFCHGVPSYGLWKAFLEQQPAPVKQIHFRSKRRGWHSYTMEINGQTMDKLYEKKKLNSPA